MTPTKKGKTTHIRIEKKRKEELDTSAAEHVGDGINKGFVVNKKAQGMRYTYYIDKNMSTLLTFLCTL